MKAVFKVIVRFMSFLVVLPLVAIHFSATKLSAADRIFQSISQGLSLIPGTLGEYLRAAFYRQVCSQVHETTSIGFLTILSHSNTSIATNVYIGAQGNIGMCSIGKDCLFGSGVHILSGKTQHSFSDRSMPIKNQGGVFEKIDIGEDCWVGNSAVIMANIGKRCIVAAGSVVTKPVEDYTIVGGNPAKPIGSTQ